MWLEQRPRLITEGTDTSGSSIVFVLPDPTPGALDAGTLIMRVRIDAEGRMQDATLVHRSNPQRNTQALRALAAIPRVEPGRDRGVPTACIELIPFRFKRLEE